MPYNPWTLIGWLLAACLLVLIVIVPVAARAMFRAHRRAMADWEVHKQRFDRRLSTVRTERDQAIYPKGAFTGASKASAASVSAVSAATSAASAATSAASAICAAQSARDACCGASSARAG